MGGACERQQLTVHYFPDDAFWRLPAAHVRVLPHELLQAWKLVRLQVFQRTQQLPLQATEGIAAKHPGLVVPDCHCVAQAVFVLHSGLLAGLNGVLVLYDIGVDNHAYHCGRLASAVQVADLEQCGTHQWLLLADYDLPHDMLYAIRARPSCSTRSWI